MMEPLLMKRVLIPLAVVAAGCLLMPFIGLWGNHSAKINRAAAGSQVDPVEPLSADEPRVEFAQDRVAKGGDVQPLPFDGQRAMTYLRKVCDLGPRISGSP